MDEPPIERFDDARMHGESTLKPIEERVSPGARAVFDRLVGLIEHSRDTELPSETIGYLILGWLYGEEDKHPWSLRAAMRHAKEGRL